MNEYLTGSTAVICITILIILFAGTPDLMDALIKWAGACHG